MKQTSSVRFFEEQFRRQVQGGDLHLNPFEMAVLPFLHGRVLDYGCGLGNLAVAAARRGCPVRALDASHAAIEHLRRVAREQALPIEAEQRDLRSYEIGEDFDAVVAIGLLMFFDCATAFRQLRGMQSAVRAGGVAAVNVLVEGTTFLDMFDAREFCLFPPGELQRRFQGWEILLAEHGDFPAPNDQVKSFDTLVARKPL